MFVNRWNWQKGIKMVPALSRQSSVFAKENLVPEYSGLEISFSRKGHNKGLEGKRGGDRAAAFRRCS